MRIGAKSGEKYRYILRNWSKTESSELVVESKRKRIGRSILSFQKSPDGVVRDTRYGVSDEPKNPDLLPAIELITIATGLVPKPGDKASRFSIWRTRWKGTLLSPIAGSRGLCWMGNSGFRSPSKWCPNAKVCARGSLSVWWYPPLGEPRSKNHFRKLWPVKAFSDPKR